MYIHIYTCIRISINQSINLSIIYMYRERGREGGRERDTFYTQRAHSTGRESDLLPAIARRSGRAEPRARARRTSATAEKSRK